MPKETFIKLSEEKKNKIITSAKKEFARVPIEQVSIKNIVEDAEIARGSFYQYFESKEDLLEYIISKHFEDMNFKIKKQLENVNGNLFEFFIEMYDFIINSCDEKNDMEFYKKIFENMRTSQNFLASEKIIKQKPFKITNFIENIDTSNLRIKNKEDLETIEKILFAVTNKAIVMSFKYNTKEDAKKDFLKQIEFLKYGICFK